MFTFNSRIRVDDKKLNLVDENIIKNEIMFFGCDLDYVIKNGGPLSWQFISNLSKEFIDSKDLIIDSRVHMLMPGWFPCIPGFHHDDVPRSLNNGQPNYTNPEYKAKHCLALVNGEIAATEFALGAAEFPEPKPDEKCYKIWHPIVEYYLDIGVLRRHFAPSNRMIYFDCQTWHQGVRATGNGWRWFMRASINTNRPIKNEVRRQVQVYLENPMEGW